MQEHQLASVSITWSNLSYLENSNKGLETRIKFISALKQYSL